MIKQVLETKGEWEQNIGEGGISDWRRMLPLLQQEWGLRKMKRERKKICR